MRRNLLSLSLIAPIILAVLASDTHSRLATLSSGCGPPCSTFCKLPAGLPSTGTPGDRMGSTDAALDPHPPRTAR